MEDSPNGKYGVIARRPVVLDPKIGLGPARILSLNTTVSIVPVLP